MTRTLCHADLLDTLTIVHPRWGHLSPCYGAMLAVSPVVGNMMRFQQQNSTTTGDLATKLFWQTDRFAPLQLSRNKSHPVAHMTPRLMGILWQVANNNDGVNNNNNNNKLSSLSEKMIKEQKVLLQKAGIRSNHVHDEWTGVSMARWMNLLSSLRPPPPPHRPNDPVIAAAAAAVARPVYYPPLTIAPWLAALWQMARTKNDLLEFLLAMEEYGGGVAAAEGSILDDRNELSRALRHDDGARQEWARSSFTADEITPDRAHEALDRLVSSSLSHDRFVADFGSRHEEDSNRLVEVIAASRAIQHAAQPVVPNGRYGYDGGRPKSDCVEVVVREILNLMLWDESRACFDLSRWPYRPSDELVQLYGPPQQPQGHHRPVVVDEGQLWFNVLSNRPGCDYLAVSPQGQAYELTPTMANVARVVQQLLLGGLDNAGTEWITLEELARTWNDARRADTPRLTVTSSQRSFRPPLSDQFVHEEHATLFFDGSKYGITIKLDQRREFATVAHVRLCTDRIDSGLLTRLRQRSLQNPTDVTWTLLCLAILGDHGLGQEDDDAAPTRSTSCHHEKNASSSCIAVMTDLLAAPFGPDRRELMELAGTSDLEVEDRAHAQALRMSRNVLAQSVARVCGDQNLEESLTEDLLSWLLQESPCVLPEQVGHRLSYDPRVEDELLRLSPAALARLALKSGDWACRDGYALAHVVQYQLGLQSSRNLVFQDVHGHPSGFGQLFSKLMYYLKL